MGERNWSIVLQNALLKSLVLQMRENEEWKHELVALSKASFTQFNDGTREKKPRCIKCMHSFENFLTLIFHIQMQHPLQLQIFRYELIKDTLKISTRKAQHQPKNYFQQIQGKTQLTASLSQRTNQIIAKIMSKFQRIKTTQKRIYYHSNDIFREVGPQSANEDSEDEFGEVERELEGLRIDQFTDVNDRDKHFFKIWNNAIHTTQKETPFLTRKQLLRTLKQFAANAHSKSILRMNLIMHLWTLWSAGKISSDDVLATTAIYDSSL